MEFADQVANLEISDDEAMVSFDVVSLFTVAPVKKACEYIRKKLNEDTTLHLRTNLTSDEIISLLDFTLSNIYFVYKDSIYKQIHGCAMGSPVSPVVANLYMEIIEESAISASATPPKVWKRYVDDSFVIIKKNSSKPSMTPSTRSTRRFLLPLKQRTMDRYPSWTPWYPERMVLSLLMFTENLLIRTGTWIFIHTTRRNTR